MVLNMVIKVLPQNFLERFSECMLWVNINFIVTFWHKETFFKPTVYIFSLKIQKPKKLLKYNKFCILIIMLNLTLPILYTRWIRTLPLESHVHVVLRCLNEWIFWPLTSQSHDCHELSIVFNYQWHQHPQKNP